MKKICNTYLLLTQTIFQVCHCGGQFGRTNPKGHRGFKFKDDQRKKTFSEESSAKQIKRFLFWQILNLKVQKKNVKIISLHVKKKKQKLYRVYHMDRMNFEMLLWLHFWWKNIQYTHFDIQEKFLESGSFFKKNPIHTGHYVV